MGTLPPGHMSLTPPAAYSVTCSTRLNRARPNACMRQRGAASGCRTQAHSRGGPGSPRPSPGRPRSGRHWYRRWRRWPGLAARAVIGVPGVDIISLYGADHSLAAAAARFSTPLVHPVLLPAGQFPGGGLLGTVGVCQQKLPSQGHHGVGIDVADGNPGRYPQKETHLRLVQVSDPDQHRISTHYLTWENTTNVGLSNPPNNHPGRFWGLPRSASGLAVHHITACGKLAELPAAPRPEPRSRTLLVDESC